MTRLRTEDIKGIAGQLEQYEKELARKTGSSIRGIACYTLDIPEGTFTSIAASVEVGIVPFQSDKGIIEGFCDTVKHIVRHIGFKAFVTEHYDVSGIAEAVERNAEVIMMADDYRFVALNTRSNRMADNANATGKGFVAGLDLMSGGIKDKKVLIIGCGPVGRNSAIAALQREANVSVIDLDPRRSQLLARDIYKAMRKRIGIENDLAQALQYYPLVVEATNAAGIIDAHHLGPGMYMAAPGVPLGLTPAAAAKISHRLLHDPLQIGVAVMAADAVLSRSIEDWRIMLPYGSYIASVAPPTPKISIIRESIPEPGNTPQKTDHDRGEKTEQL